MQKIEQASNKESANQADRREYDCDPKVLPVRDGEPKQREDGQAGEVRDKEPYCGTGTSLHARLKLCLTHIPSPVIARTRASSSVSSAMILMEPVS